MTASIKTDSRKSKDPKKFITPFAFSVSPELYGVALGSPLKRGVAILIDLAVVVLLAELSSSLLAALMALVFWQLSREFSRAGMRPKLTLFLRVLATLILFTVVSLHFFYDKASESEFSRNWDIELSEGGEEDLSILDAATYATLVLRQQNLVDEQRKLMSTKNCPDPVDCWQPLVDDFAIQLLELNAPPSIAKEMVESIVRETGVSRRDAQRIFSDLPADYLELQKESVIEEKPEVQDESLAAKTVQAGDVEESEPGNLSDSGDLSDSSSANENRSYQGGSIIKFLQGLMADLGLGFGWAAFYFTVMAAWFRGQTVGKYIMGLKVIKLNGEQMGLWESFGRYGGYGAGFATGLLGFIQIYWDPNRQAIQDKISETLVIDVRKTSYKWPDDSQ